MLNIHIQRIFKLNCFRLRLVLNINNQWKNLIYFIGCLVIVSLEYNFMLNLNKNYFGKFNHELINNVNCFPFDNCVHFILDLRKKLDEIDIHDWIDFIFGYLQSKFDDEHFRLFPKFSY